MRDRRREADYREAEKSDVYAGGSAPVDDSKQKYLKSRYGDASKN
jgi:hypothetical protein